ncbi:MAG: hypothetical protein FD157_3519 [Rhodocyclaceae bacterium]|nr:MAG: hypothetical protein FD157_3519 [Rhodocyclaceae bacterium]TND01868.1 MAG: hypothetical protein FD118_2127 [Rhodocyclaceae bacterium]
MQRRYTLALFRQLSMAPTVFVYVFVGAVVGSAITFPLGIAVGQAFCVRG